VSGTGGSEMKCVLIKFSTHAQLLFVFAMIWLTTN
jgi:hypothetical protein